MLCLSCASGPVIPLAPQPCRVAPTSQASYEKFSTQWEASLNSGNPSLRNALIKTLYAHLAEIAPTRTTAEWMALCEQLDIPVSPIYSLDDLPEHPHLKAVGLFEDVEHPTVGPIRQVRPTTLFSRTPASIHRPVPTVGQHTEEVLREIGMSDEEVARVTRR